MKMFRLAWFLFAAGALVAACEGTSVEISAEEKLDTPITYSQNEFSKQTPTETPQEAERNSSDSLQAPSTPTSETTKSSLSQRTDDERKPETEPTPPIATNKDRATQPTSIDKSPTASPSWENSWQSDDLEGLRSWYLGNTGINAAGLSDADLKPSGSVSTTADDQVIDGLLVTGGITIRHNNVTVRNTKIVGTQVGIRVPYDSRDRVNQLTVENVSIIGDPEAVKAVKRDPKTYDAPDRGIESTYAQLVARNVYVSGRTAGIRPSSGNDGDIIEYSMIENIITDSCVAKCKSSHNTGISFRGGSDKTIYRNWVEGSSSSALSMYPDAAPITGAVIEENVFDGGTYSIIGGNAEKKYADQTVNNKIVNNLFSRNYRECDESKLALRQSEPTLFAKYCSRAISRFSTSLPGNTKSGNEYMNPDGSRDPL